MKYTVHDPKSIVFYDRRGRVFTSLDENLYFMRCVMRYHYRNQSSLIFHKMVHNYTQNCGINRIM